MGEGEQPSLTESDRYVEPQGQVDVDPVLDIKKKEVVSFKSLNISELLNDEKMLESFLNCFVRVFSEVGEGEWAESWTVEKAKERLIERISKFGSENFQINLMLNEQDVVGFCFGAVLDSFDNYTDLPNGDFNNEQIVSVVRKKISELFPATLTNPVLAIMELGITLESRSGLERIINLVNPVLQYGETKGAKTLLFWTSEKSRLYALSMVMGLKILHNYDGPDKFAHIGVDLVQLNELLARSTQVLLDRFKK